MQTATSSDAPGNGAFAAAFAAAGWVDPLDKLARDAWAKWSTADGRGARRDYVKAGLTPALTLALLERYRPHVLRQIIVESIAELLAEADIGIRDAAKAAGGGQGADDTQESVAPATSPGVKPADDRGQYGSDTQRRTAPIVTKSRDAGASSRSAGANPCTTPTGAAPPAANTKPAAAATLKTLADKHEAAMRATIATSIEMCKLHTEIINGQPVGKVRVDEARAWASKHGVRARWITLLTANMPDHWVIGEHVPPALADELYARAEAEHAA